MVPCRTGAQGVPASMLKGRNSWHGPFSFSWQPLRAHSSHSSWTRNKLPFTYALNTVEITERFYITLKPSKHKPACEFLSSCPANTLKLTWNPNVLLPSLSMQTQETYDMHFSIHSEQFRVALAAVLCHGEWLCTQLLGVKYRGSLEPGAALDTQIAL